MTSPQSLDNTIEPGGKPFRKLIRLCVALGLLITVIVGGPRIWQAATQQPIPPLPEIDLANSSPRVRAVIERARQSVRDSPRDGTAWGQLGMILFAHQFDIEAQPCFEQAEALDPHDVRWPYLHGLTVSPYDRESGIRSFQRALERSRNSGVIHNRLGEVLLELGKYDEAEQALREAHRLQPEEIRPCIALARLEIARSDFDAALVWVTEAVRRDPDRRLLHELLANVHEGLGNREDALREIELASSLPEQPLLWNDPFAAQTLQLRRDADRQFEIARSMLEQQRFPEAIALMQAALQDDNRDPQKFCLLGQTLRELGQTAAAAQILERGQAEHPRSAKIQFQWGVLYFQLGEFPKSEQSFRAALEIKPDYAMAHYNLGHTRERLGNLPGTLASFESAVRSQPTDANAHRELGRILLELNRAEDAKPHLEAAIRFAPHDEVAKSLLEKASLGPRPATNQEIPDIGRG